MTRRFVIPLMLAALAGAVHAEDAQQDAMREVGAVLGWRLGPETLEEGCRDADPQGAASRKQALDTWLARNAALIKSADTRVGEVLPMLYPEAPRDKVVGSIRDQVKLYLGQSIFAGHSQEELRAMCQQETDPKRPRWNNNGMPHIQQSLAALYDWETTHGSGCLKFEPSVVELEGVPVLRDYPGPPNYESVASGDALERQWILQLSTPQCVDPAPDSSVDGQALAGVREIQLVLPVDQVKGMKKFGGKVVRISGTLFAAQTGHHRTAVLLRVDKSTPPHLMP